MPKLYRDATTGQYTTPDVTELRDQIAGTIHRRICEHSREDCIENLGKCERATDSAMPLISTALDEGHAMARLLADALKDAIRTLRELAEKAAGEPIPFDDFDLYAEVVDGALDAAAERDRLARLLDEPRRSGCAVEIAGVRIAPCDERGQTADMRERDTLADRLAHMTEARDNARAEVERLTALVEAVREYAAARQANIDHGPLLSARKAAHDALLAALARLDASADA